MHIIPQKHVVYFSCSRLTEESVRALAAAALGG